jgi:hypothetical protein
LRPPHIVELVNLAERWQALLVSGKAPNRM